MWDGRLRNITKVTKEINNKVEVLGGQLELLKKDQRILNPLFEERMYTLIHAFKDLKRSKRWIILVLVLLWPTIFDYIFQYVDL